jgi:hypothetical protein
MTYSVKLVGSDRKIEFQAASFSEAVAAYSHQVSLPSAGWLIAEASSGAFRQFQVRDGVVCYDIGSDSLGETGADQIRKPEVTIERAIADLRCELVQIREECSKTKWAARAIALIIVSVVISGFAIRMK